MISKTRVVNAGLGTLSAVMLQCMATTARADDLDAILFDDGNTTQQTPATTTPAASDAPASDAADAPTPAAPASATAQAPTSADNAAPDKDDVQELLPTVPVKMPPAGAKTSVASGSDAGKPALEEIVVTATKEVMLLREIPASITALSGGDLERSGAQSAQDFIKLVPGVNLTSTGDSPPRITIRGISSDIGTGSTTGIIFGNVSFTDAYVPFLALDPNPFDLQSVEVLKGPQGTLFGAAALNGAVRYVPTAPQFGVWQARYFGQYTKLTDGDGKPTYGAVVNVPLGKDDNAALRVMGFARHSPGYIDNEQVGVKDANHLDQAGLRGMLGWHPDDKSDVEFTYAWQKTEAHDPGLSDNANGNLKTSDRPRLSYNNNAYSFANLAMRYSFDWADLISETAYVRKNGHNFFDSSSRELPNPPIPLTAQEYFAESKTYSQEIRLASPAGHDSPWRWVGGVSLFQQPLKENLVVPLGDASLPTAALIPILNSVSPGLGDLFSATGIANVLDGDIDVKVKEYALFGNISRTFFDDWELNLGGRLYKTSSGGSNAYSGLTVLAIYQKPQYVLDGGVSERGFNPKASLSWHATDDIMSYVTVSKGFRVGGIQPGLTTPLSQKPAPPIFKSDTIWNYEAGLRTQWLENTLHFDLTAFTERWKQPQTLQADASGLSTYIDNVGGVKSTGAELALEYLFPIDGLKLNATAGYIKTVTTKEFTASNGKQAPVGTPWPLSPKWQTATTLSYLLSLSDWKVGSSITHTYLGSAITDLTSKRPAFGYQQWDAQLSLANPDISWLPEIALTGTNLANKRGVTNQFSSEVPTADTAALEVYYIQPRALTLRIMGHFGS